MAASRPARGSRGPGRRPQCRQRVSARHVAADEREDGGEGDEAGVGAAGPAARAAAVAVMLWMSSSAQCFLPGEFGGLAAQGAAGAADGLLQVEERDFHLPSFGIQGGDLAGGIGVRVQEGGQDPDERGFRPAAAGAGGDGEGDEPGRGARQPLGVRVARLAAPPGPHAVGFAEHDQLRPVGQGADRLERDGFRAVLDPPGQVRAGGGEPDPPVHGEEPAVGEVEDAGP